MPGFLSNLLQILRERRGSDMLFLCRHLLSERGEASQTVLAERIIKAYREMSAADRVKFFEMLCRDFGPDPAAISRAAAEYEKNPSAETLVPLFSAVEPPRQELVRRINTASHGTETLVTMRGHLLELAGSKGANFAALDADLRHLFKSWFNRGFLRLERISWHTPAHVLEKLIHYEAVHEINGWPDLRRRLAADRRCFAFFHPALDEEPIIFIEIALSNQLTGELEPLLDIKAPVLAAEKANTAIFYSINNCLAGLRAIPFGNFLIKQVVVELAAELPEVKNYATLSPLPRFARALKDDRNADGFTRERLSRLLADYAQDLTSATRERDPVEAFHDLLQKPLENRKVLAAPLEPDWLLPISRKPVMVEDCMTPSPHFTLRMALVWSELMRLATCDPTVWKLPLGLPSITGICLTKSRKITSNSFAMGRFVSAADWLAISERSPRRGKVRTGANAAETCRSYRT